MLEMIKMVMMWLIGFLLIYLAIKKEYEPALLLPMGFGAILVNLPRTGVLNQYMEGIGEVNGIIQWLYETGIEASEAFPILLFIGIVNGFLMWLFLRKLKKEQKDTKKCKFRFLCCTVLRHTSVFLWRSVWHC